MHKMLAHLYILYICIYLTAKHSSWMQTVFFCSVLVTYAITLKLNLIESNLI